MTGLENKLRAALRDTAGEIPADPPPLRLPPARDPAPGPAGQAPLDRLGRPAGRRRRGPRGGRRLAGRGPRRVRADDEQRRPGRRPAVLRRPDGARLSRRVRRERHGRRGPGHGHRRGAGEGRPAQAVRPLRRRNRGRRSPHVRPGRGGEEPPSGRCSPARVLTRTTSRPVSTSCASTRVRAACPCGPCRPRSSRPTRRCTTWPCRRTVPRWPPTSAWDYVGSHLIVFDLATGTERAWSFKTCASCHPSGGGLGYGGTNVDALSWTARREARRVRRA